MRRAAIVAAALGASLLVGWQLVAREPSFTPPADSSLPSTRITPKTTLPGGAGDRIAFSASGPDAQPIRSLLNIRSPMQYGEYRWNDDGVPPGPIWVRVGLRQQTLSVFRGGDEIGTAVILYGADSKPTPLGTFRILARLKDHRSGPYDAPMPFTLRLTADGVAIHGSNVRWGAATHGCVGVPLEFAARLFEVARVGDPVTITEGVASPTHS